MPGPLDFLSGIPIIGPLLGGLFGGGGGAQPQGGGAAGGGADPLAALSPLLNMIGMQNPGGLGPLGAALGVGGQGGGAGGLAALAPLAGAILGGGQGGGIGQQVGSSAAGAFLANQLARSTEQRDPTAQAGLQELGRRAAQDPITQNQERVARDTVQRVKDELGPELNSIRQLARERANQVQATSEHREIVARDEFRREVLNRLRTIESQNARAGVNRRF
jgi:hypothetical protein